MQVAVLLTVKTFSTKKSSRVVQPSDARSFANLSLSSLTALAVKFLADFANLHCFMRNLACICQSAEPGNVPVILEALANSVFSSVSRFQESAGCRSKARVAVLFSSETGV